MSDQEKNVSTNSPVESNHSGSKEDLSDVSASESKLVGDDTKSLIFGKTSMDEAELQWMVTNRMLERASVHLPKGETTPKAEPHECVIFRDQFTPGLRMPCQILLKKF
jgi:hypothetical protein